MASKIILTPNAQKDIQQAIDWENERSEGLGRRFLMDLEARFNDLAITLLSGDVSVAHPEA